MNFRYKHLKYKHKISLYLKFVYSMLPIKVATLGMVFSLLQSFMSQHVFALDQLARAPDVNVEVWVERKNSPLPVDAVFVGQVGALTKFIGTQIFPVIPEEDLKKLKAHPMKIILDENAPAFEFFQPAQDNPNNLEVQIRPSTLMSKEILLLLSHAYFHALQYVVHPDPDEKTWRNEQWFKEGMADLFEFLVMSTASPTHQIAALTEHETPLLGTYELDRPNPEQYGHDLLYLNYLIRECGGKTLFWNLAESKDGVFGTETVEYALNLQRKLNPDLVTKPQCASFEESATSFEIARFLNKEDFSTQNKNRYFLTSTSFPFAPPLKAFDLEVASEIAKSGRFTPFIFEGAVSLPQSALSGLKHFWLQLQFPNEVRDIQPTSLEGWVQLIFKP